MLNFKQRMVFMVVLIKKVKPGSALLLLITSLFFFVLLIGIIIRMTVYGSDIVACRQRTIEQYYATEALVLYGCALCNQQPHRYKNCHAMVVYNDKWFENKHKTWRGKVVATCKNGSGTLQAQLLDENAVIAEMTCSIAQVQDAMKIVSWS